MVSAVLSDTEIRGQTLRSQRNFGFSLVTAIALHLAVFVAFINFSFDAEQPQLMMPASQLIKATLVILPAPEPVAQLNFMPAAATPQKTEPVPLEKPKPAPKKVSRALPKPILPAEPQLFVETVQEPVEIQHQPTAIAAVDEAFEEMVPREVIASEELYLPPSSNVAYYQNPKPHYPMAAKRRGMEGVVELRVMVDSRGTPTTIEIKQSSGFQVLDREAIKAVWQWRFQAAKRAGMVVAGEVIVPVRYQLDSV